ncbi:uncharacterized protein LOC132619683 [Lycium barbarum]|uniref:uncharacterized protein LOC132619683 n=1 Tax=Lycium barbarum TaxID=112863 RepID=UPI00293E677A|nr:uncharacterized protein LOC132619683 [Lycium barbarum]
MENNVSVEKEQQQAEINKENKENEEIQQISDTNDKVVEKETSGEEKEGTVDNMAMHNSFSTQDLVDNTERGGINKGEYNKSIIHNADYPLDADADDQQEFIELCEKTGVSPPSRGVRSKKAIQRLKRLVNKYKVDMVAISEPLKDYYSVSIMQDHEQQVTLSIQTNQSRDMMYITTIYAKCTKADRKELWASLEDLNKIIKGPWIIGGDFNVILQPEEKLGGLPHRNSKSFDLFECMDSCGMSDVGFHSSKYTWCNNWRPSIRIWKRLDRVFINDDWTKMYANNFVKHLARTDSDHRPLLVRCDNGHIDGPKYFKFLDFWTTQDDFLEVVRMNWNQSVTGNLVWILQQKLKVLLEDSLFGQDRKLVFNLKPRTPDLRISECIPNCINKEDNDHISSCLKEEEIKSTVFDMSDDSAAGPAGFSALIPKVDSPANFSDLRPISINNFSSKIITKILSKRLNPLLPFIISENQSGFLKGNLSLKIFC